jgi:hypothetical protein
MLRLGGEGMGAASGIFGRDGEEESLLHNKTKQLSAPPLPEKLVTQSQIDKRHKRSSEEQPQAGTAGC